MILKLLLIIGVIAAVYFFFMKKSMPLTTDRKTTKKTPPTADETMVECATCGTFIVTSEALISGSRFYCCSECRDKA